MNLELEIAAVQNPALLSERGQSRAASGAELFPALMGSGHFYLHFLSVD